MIAVTNEKMYEFRCLSTDAKPITKGYVKGESSYTEVDYVISNGSTLLELNKTTGESKVYLFVLEEVTVEEETKLKGTWIEMK